jgi:hypothetical protein
MVKFDGCYSNVADAKYGEDEQAKQPSSSLV